MIPAVTIDPETGAVYIRYSHEPVVSTDYPDPEEKKCSVFVDEDAAGRVVGVEVIV